MKPTRLVSRRLLGLASLCVACCGSSVVAQDLAAGVKAALADKVMARAEVGIEIVRLGATPDTSRPIFQQNHDTPFIPASNLKIVTTAAALEGLGRDFRFKTRLLLKPVKSTTEPTRTTGEFDVIIIGDGDPTFGDAELLRKVGWDVDTVYKNWAEKLKARGVTKVRQVLVDDSVFDAQMIHPDWPTDQLHKRYVAGVSGLNFNANCLDFYIAPGSSGVVNYSTVPQTKYAMVENSCVYGTENAIWLSRMPTESRIVLKGTAPRGGISVPVSVTVDDPSLFAGVVFSEVLQRSGVQVSGGVKRDRAFRILADRNQLALIDTTSVAVHETPIELVIQRANKDSMNLYADALCKRLGFEKRGEGTWENGNAEIEKYLRNIGVKGAMRLADGCGLSKNNAISARAITAVLVHEFTSENRKLFVESMSIAGVDGTIKDQFQGYGMEGRVFAKSGFVNGVSCLSGYLLGRDGQWYAFSVLINKISGGGKQVRERVVAALDKYTATLPKGRAE